MARNHRFIIYTFIVVWAGAAGAASVWDARHGTVLLPIILASGMFLGGLLAISRRGVKAIPVRIDSKPGDQRG